MDLRRRINILSERLPQITTKKTGRKQHRLVVLKREDIRQLGQGTKFFPMVTWKKSGHIYEPQLY